MRWIRSWRRRRDPRIVDEIRFHRDRLVEDYVAGGMTRAEAERRAFLEFGNVGAIEESVRDVRGRWLDDLAKDLIYAVRTLRRSPGFSFIAVLSLALGIGANSAIFSVVNAVILRALPVEDPGRLVRIARVLEGRPAQVSYRLFETLRDNMTTIAGAFAQQSTTQTVSIGGLEDTVAIDLVSESYFTVLGVDAAVGRVLGAADHVRPPSALAAVISDRYWQRRFGSSPSALGTLLTIRDRVFTIVGVTPPSFAGARTDSPPDLILPLLPMMTDVQRTQAGFNFLTTLARLKPGATAAQALTEVQAIYQPFLDAQAAETTVARERAVILGQRITALYAPGGVNPIRDYIQEPLLILMGIVGLILMLACVNVAGLLLARAAARQRETSIRLAIGAGRGRLVRQFLTESFVLAALGGTAGFALANPLSERLFALFLNGRPIDLIVAPDWRVAVFTAAIALGACFVSGLAPALGACRVSLNPALKEVKAGRRGRLGASLVVVQLAISMILVVGAALFIGTLVKLYAVDRGFDIERLIAVQIRSNRQYNAERTRLIQRDLLEQLRALPGVRFASAGSLLPVGGGLWDRTVRVENHTSWTGEPAGVAFNAIAPDYFAALGTPMIAGREFSERDASTSPPVAIVNESFARSFFGDLPALGRHVTSVGVTYEIVGIVADAKYQDLRESVRNTMYIPWTQRDESQIYSFVVRADDDPRTLFLPIERVVREADPRFRVARLQHYSAWIDATIPTERLMAALGGLFGALALVLAGVGMFGLLAFQVARRTNELGVRMVLGATRWSMTRLVLRDVVAMVVPGVIVGASGAFMLTGLARSILFGLTPTEPAVFVLAASILGVSALVAAWVPARRASSVDPLAALRHE